MIRYARKYYAKINALQPVMGKMQVAKWASKDGVS